MTVMALVVLVVSASPALASDSPRYNSSGPVAERIMLVLIGATVLFTIGGALYAWWPTSKNTSANELPAHEVVDLER
ncbi:MAG: hypothetical protein ACR2P0_09565 [Acidimicrobiales bacterium]